MLLKSRTSILQSQPLIGVTLLLIGIWIAWQLGGRIVSGDLRSIEFAALGFAGCSAAVAILRNWRLGFYFFLFFLLFEDLARKYMGNSLALFFGADILAALMYVALYMAIRKHREKTFRPPFLLPLMVFVWLGAVQIFNLNSPSILYGLLGFKLYFFYIPLIWAGYALIRSDEDLQKFLVVNAALAAVIASAGIIQAIVGNGFLNPRVLAPDLVELGDLSKVTPLTGQILNLPDSVFVSSGRFGAYVLVAFIVVVGSAGYLVLLGRRGRIVAFMATGTLAAATLLSGSRGCIVYTTASALVLAVGLLWGAPKKQRQARRLRKAIRRSIIFGALGLAGILVFFPEQAGSRIAYYTETLSPSSSAYQGTERGWTYPLQNLKDAFMEPNWILGNGIGVASLGTQYVSKVLRQPPPDLWVEEGFGVLIVEMGIVAPFLWLLWSGAMAYSCWKVVWRLRGTRFFPVAFAIFWYVPLLLLLLTWGGFSLYQNYITNAYLWLLVGILFRLPHLLASTTTPASTVLPETVAVDAHP
jgi:hypothetical protein